LAGNDLDTPLHWAAKNGDLDLVKLLLEIGVNLNAISTSKNAPLHLAAEHGHTEVARLLVDSGADATSKGYVSRHSQCFGIDLLVLMDLYSY
jgi:ankyrin repeat protein